MTRVEKFKTDLQKKAQQVHKYYDSGSKMDKFRKTMKELIDSNSDLDKLFQTFAEMTIEYMSEER